MAEHIAYFQASKGHYASRLEAQQNYCCIASQRHGPNVTSMKEHQQLRMMDLDADGEASTDTSNAIVGCNSSSDSSSAFSLNIPTSYYDKRWIKAASLMRTDPSLVTGNILISALKNKAPINAIKFFLSVNPKAAGIPKEGPTPLQVAVQHNASKEVIRELIVACPFALIVTTSAEWLDPLSYARRYRSSETDLIALLSRPLGSWIHPNHSDGAVHKKADARATSARTVPAPAMQFLKKAKQSEKTSLFSAEDKEELQNVKQLCLSVMKGQKRLVREVGRVKDSVERNTAVGETDIDGSAAGTIHDMQEVSIFDIEELGNSQQRNLRTHLIALDMKEQAMRAYVHQMEDKILQSLQVTKQEYVAEKSYEDAFRGLRDDLHNAARRMDEFVGTLEHRMTDVEVRLDHEANVNATFRNGLQHHLGINSGEQEGFEVISVVENTPLVFATPYQKPPKDDAVDVPLCPKEEAPEKHPKSCLWPRFLTRRRNPPHSLT
ncbi:expressed unknown protein [Seminavis robusta]|uniref:Uncharacterized protein n=1 Tax=Seminavis robusta TaxID=568900 RepID=A0A9N8HTZ7_9STRA|nr:expressed unknown protein [Seminavis robusta]|eukprot:Sro1969_g308460.1 n/a (493) ;mRNA; r:3975-5615